MSNCSFTESRITSVGTAVSIQQPILDLWILRLLVNGGAWPYIQGRANADFSERMQPILCKNRVFATSATESAFALRCALPRRTIRQSKNPNAAFRTRHHQENCCRAY